MANSNWREATNSVLNLAGLKTIATDELFNNSGGGQLQQFQSQTKWFIKLVHQFLFTRAHNHFARRLIPQILESGTAEYNIDTGLDPESIRFDSFYNRTNDSSLSPKNQKLTFWTYDKYRQYYPDPNNIPTGAPEAWVLNPIDRDIGETPVHSIIIAPTPDAAYTLEFEAKLNVNELTTATDKILYPKHYEHCLMLHAWELVETALGEGKTGRIAQLAEKAAAEVRLVSAKLPDARKVPRTMKIPSIRRRARVIDSPNDIV